MSTAESFIPEWDLADRLRKSLREAEISVGEMAARFEVNRNTIGNWLNGRTVPSASDLRVWSNETCVPVEWLRWGVVPPNDPSDQGVTRSGWNADAEVVELRTILNRAA